MRDVFAAAGQGDSALGASGIAVPLIGQDGQRHVAHALPLTSGARRRAGVAYRAVAALFVRKAAPAMPPRSEVIGKAFKLTPTELLLAIVEVGGVPEVAVALGVAETTIRTHVGRLFERPAPRDRPISSNSSRDMRCCKRTDRDSAAFIVHSEPGG